MLKIGFMKTYLYKKSRISKAEIVYDFMEKALKYDKALQPGGTWEISESEENDKGCGLADRVLRAKKPRKQLRVRSPRTSNAVPRGS